MQIIHQSGTDRLIRDEDWITAVAALYQQAFAASEGADEGAQIGALVRRLLLTTKPEDIHAFTTWEGDRPLGGALFTRLVWPGDPRTVFILSPVAVDPAQQRRGIGTALLSHAVAAMRAQGADALFTYGDPAYYLRVGFGPVAESQARAPLPLSFPHGWLAQSLTGAPLAPFAGPSRCVAALDEPHFW